MYDMKSTDQEIAVAPFRDECCEKRSPPHRVHAFWPVDRFNPPEIGRVHAKEYHPADVVE